MLDGNHQEPGIDALIKKIKDEAKKRKLELADSPVPEDFSPLDNEGNLVDEEIQETTIYKLIKRIQTKLRTYPFYKYLYGFANKFKKIIPKYRHNLPAKELLNHHDMEFIDNAYRTILRRAPDPQALDHLMPRLRNGLMSKIEILGNLRYSTEGKSQNVKIEGLYLRFKLQRAYKIPVLGYFLNATVAIMTLPLLAKRTQAIEARTHENEAVNRDRYAQIASSLQELKNQQENIQQVELPKKADVRVVEKNEQQVRGMREQVRTHEQNILSEMRKLMTLIEASSMKPQGAIVRDHLRGVMKEEDHLLDALYVAFEDRFRGTREDIKNRVKMYLSYIRQVVAGTDSAPLLDLGCGRGEWLELMKENGFTATGVELNRVMIQQCKTLGLNVIETDAIEYLRNESSDSLSAITGFHIIEHLPFKALLTLFDESLRVLKPGGMVLFETPNPENLLVSAYTFHFDPTHQAPLVPDSMQFILEQRGFINTEIVRSHKYSDFHVVPEAEQTDFNKKWFYTETDFAVIGYKS